MATGWRLGRPDGMAGGGSTQSVARFAGCVGRPTRSFDGGVAAGDLCDGGALQRVAERRVARLGDRRRLIASNPVATGRRPPATGRGSGRADWQSLVWKRRRSATSLQVLRRAEARGPQPMDDPLVPRPPSLKSVGFLERSGDPRPSQSCADGVRVAAVKALGSRHRRCGGVAQSRAPGPVLGGPKGGSRSAGREVDGDENGRRRVSVDRQFHPSGQPSPRTSSFAPGPHSPPPARASDPARSTELQGRASIAHGTRRPRDRVLGPSPKRAGIR
jgi:hypothetical protein